MAARHAHRDDWLGGMHGLCEELRVQRELAHDLVHVVFIGCGIIRHCKDRTLKRLCDEVMPI